MKEYFIYFLLISIYKSQVNILIGKQVRTSDYPDYAKNIADGDKNSCMWFRSRPVIFAVFDLQKVHEIEKVVMYNGNFRGNVLFSIYMGDEFRTCHFPNQFKKYRLCNSSMVQSQERIEVRCNESGNKGRYLAIVKGQYNTPIETEELNFCELEAFGKTLYDSPEISRPIMNDVPSKKPSREDFPLVDILRKNTPVVEVKGYGKSFIKLNKLCQPIIWDKNWNLTFALACETENRKGRAAFFNQQWFFYYLRENVKHKQMLDNYMKWLSPRRYNQELMISTTLKSRSDVLAVPEGTIVDYYSEKVHPDEVNDALLEQINEGKISLMMDSNPSDKDDPITWNSTTKILDFFNIAVDETYFIYDGNFEYTINNSDFSEELYDIEDILLRALDNTEALLSMSSSLLKTIQNFPKRLLKIKNFKNIIIKYQNKYNELLNYICPCKEDPATNINDRKLLVLLTKLFEIQDMASSGYKMPCLDLYPGDFSSTPDKNSVILQIYGEIKETRNPTGYYLEAGTTLNYEIYNAQENWFISIGCQSDTLPESKTEWYRYPNLYIDKVSISNKGTVYSAYGGVVWIINSQRNSTLKIKLSNVVATPLFNIHDKNAANDWNENQRKKPGLWAQIAGEDLVICERSDFLRNLTGEYLEKLMRTWDKVVRSLYVFASENWKTNKPEQTVVDIMPAAGNGHAGYPVVVEPNWYEDLFNENIQKTRGSWGMCHELGHNRQSSQWTFSTVTEATNNIFCLMVFPKIWNVPANKSHLINFYNSGREIKEYLEKGSPYSFMIASTTIQLFLYVHLENNLGIGFFNEIFTYYRKHPEIVLSNDQEKIDMWIKIGSNISNMNLVPIHEFWGLPIGKNVNEEVKLYECFIPDDYLTKLSESRTNFIVGKYPNCLRKSKYLKDFQFDQYVQGERPNFMKIFQN